MCCMSVACPRISSEKTGIISVSLWFSQALGLQDSDDEAEAADQAADQVRSCNFFNMYGLRCFCCPVVLDQEGFKTKETFLSP